MTKTNQTHKILWDALEEQHFKMERLKLKLFDLSSGQVKATPESIQAIYDELEQIHKDVDLILGETDYHID